MDSAIRRVYEPTHESSDRDLGIRNTRGSRSQNARTAENTWRERDISALFIEYANDEPILTIDMLKQYGIGVVALLLTPIFSWISLSQRDLASTFEPESNRQILSSVASGFSLLIAAILVIGAFCLLTNIIDI